MQLVAKHFFFTVFYVYLSGSAFSQNRDISLQPPALSKQAVFESNSADLFFVENIGQFKNRLPKALQSKILFSFENAGNPVYLTKSGLIFLQRRFHVEEKRKREKEYEEEEKELEENYVLMEFVGCNSTVEPEKISPSAHSYTYSESTLSAKGYKTIVYKNIYPGIDWVCRFTINKKNGFEYRFIINEGADASVIKMKYSGASQIKSEADGSLKIVSSFDNIFQSSPLCFETDKEDSPEKNFNFIPSVNASKQTAFEIKDYTVSFKTDAYDHSKTLVIDPFITTSSGLAGLNGGKAKDIDFDFNGNIYVSGGGNYSQHQICKYNSSGTLLWVFNGSVNSLPTAWVFGIEYGGWAVEKNTGKVYVGQGANFNPGIRVIRLSASGTYDNFVTTPVALFTECWKLIWNCGNGNPQILIAGGTTQSNLNFGVITPPSTNISPINITGIVNEFAQDIADAVVDPLNNQLYTVFAGRPSVNNRIFKHNFPYTAGTILWQVPTGYNNLLEARNRPYLHTANQFTTDNSINALAVNSNAFFYWDGSALVAYNKTNGSTLANLIVSASTPREYGGIYADECNNVFIGYSNGTIKVYKFTGNSFDDAAAADISITGFSGSAVYDLNYDQQSKLLYASGDGFIAAFNIAPYCNAADIYTLPVTVNCNPVTVQGTLQPAPPPNTIVTYSLFNGTTFISSNSTGFFTGLSAGINYTIRAVLNQSCGGTVAISNNFDVNKCEPVSAVTTNAECGNNTGTITVGTNYGIGPYQYSLNNGPFQNSNVFNNLTPGTYSVTVRDGNNLPRTLSNIIVGNTSNFINITPAISLAACGQNNGIITLTQTGGTGPYSYAINTPVNFQPSNTFSNLAPGIYNLFVRDANNCTATAQATISVFGGGPEITTLPQPATCARDNGSILVSATGGNPGYFYSINNGPFFAVTGFFNLAPGTYNVVVRDISNCTDNETVTITSIAQPVVFLIPVAANCGASDGRITVVVNGNTGPYTYSINNGPFQTSNVFNNLVAGTYNIQVNDANNCVVPATTIVDGTSSILISTASAAASCGLNNGTITVNASGGNPPYNYSINNGPFQASNVFNSLLPGTYSIRVRDLNSCIAPAVSVTVTATGSFSVNTVATQVSCGLINGIITITANGGAPPYTYSLNNGPFQTGNVFTSLAPGTYNIQVRDNTGCVTPATAVVTAAPTPAGSVASTPSTCGLNNGSITINASGGVPPYTYSINNGPFQNSNVFNSLAPATYSIQVRDNSACIIPLNGTVTAIAAPSVNTVNVPATCGLNNGLITVSANGGAPPYAYSINNGAFVTGNSFTSLAPGTYNIRVRDNNNCITPSTITIAAIPVFDVGLSSLPANCGQNNGIITVSVQGSTSPYVYSINNGPFQTSNVFSSLAPGTYAIRVQDNFNCIVPASIPVNVLSTPSISTSVSNINCSNNNNIISVTANGGAQPYAYSLNNSAFQSSNIFTQVSPGTYTIRVRDAVNCIAPVTVTVNTVPQLNISASVINTSCTANNGQLQIAVQGGTAPLEYRINNGPFQNSPIFTGLAAGTYNYTIRDANNCTRNGSETIALNNTISINTGGNKEICIDDSVKLAASVSNAASFIWLPVTALSNASVLQPKASPAATTKYYITAVNGACIKTDSLIVTVNQRPIANAGVDLITCFQQSIRLNGNGGNFYQWQPPVFLSNTGIQNPLVLNPTRNVDYVLTVTDDKGCTSKKGDTVKLFVEPLNSIFAGNDTSITVNQSLEFNPKALANTTFIQFNWSPPTGLSNPLIANPLLKLSSPNNGIVYRLTATTASGCVVTDDIRVKVFSTVNIFVPSAFTPNNDGLNDILAAIPVGIKTFNYFRIFNRWGELVFVTTDFKKGWNGTFKGIEQPPGTFTWQAEGIDFAGKTIQQIGLIHLIR